MMNSFLEQLAQLINSPTGSLLYHLILAFSALGAFYSLYMLTHGHGNRSARRPLTGLCWVIIIQLIQFFLGWLSWIGILDTRFLPVLDRAGLLLLVTALVWLWITRDKNPIIDLATVIFNLTILVATIVAGIWWVGQPTQQYFNHSNLDQSYTVIALLILGVGLAILFARRQVGWVIGVVMLGAITFGIVLHLSYPLAQDYSPTIRMAIMLSMPLIFTYPFQLQTAAVLQQAPSPASVPLRDVKLQEAMAPAPIIAPGETLGAPALTQQPEGLNEWQTSIAIPEPTQVVSSGTTGVARLTGHEFNLEDWITSLVEGRLQAWEQRDVAFRIHLPERQYDLAGNIEVLNAVIGYLCDNAIQGSPDEGEVEIKAEVLNEGSGYEILTIQISDRGEKLQTKTLSSPPSPRHPINPRFFIRKHEDVLKLAELKSAIELANGRITLENDRQFSGIYHVELPVKLATLSRKA